MSLLMLVDGHSNLYRAFYAIRAPLTAPDGTPTGAVLGFLRMHHKLLREFSPSHVAVAFDVGGETFRTQLDSSYKANRPPMPEDLEVQTPLVMEALQLLGTRVVQAEGVEADDVLGTLAVQAARSGVEVVLASGDKDLMQLVGPRIRLWHTRLERLLDESGVEEVFGVLPEQVADVLALMGDSSDNVPGCPGIGEKGARDLIRRWGSVASVYEHLAEVTPPRARKALAEHRDEVERSLELVRIRTEVELSLEPADLVVGEMDRPELVALYQRLGLSSLLADLGEKTAPASEPEGSPPIELASEADVLVGLSNEEGLGLAFDGTTLALATESGVRLCRQPSTATLKRVFASGTRLWCHDAKGLLSQLRTKETMPADLIRDTMLAGYLLAPGEPQRLADLCARHQVPPAPPDDLGGTALAVLRLAQTLEARLADLGLRPLFENLELPLAPVLERMEHAGIALDTEVLEELSARLGRSLAELERDIHHEAGGPFNINSPQQLSEVLFDRLQLPILRRTSKTRAASTDAEVLMELARRGHRLPALLLEFREQSKLKSTYVEALPRQVGADGRVHCRFNQAVTATGRLSSSDPNLQNIPVRTSLGREVRRAFVAQKGWALLAADYSQIELRVLAHLSEDPALVRAFSMDEDIHVATAALVFNVAPELVSQEQRRAAKTINFGLIYGMGAFALGRDLGVSTGEAQSFIDSYFSRMPRVREFMDETLAAARKTGMVRTMFGRPRWIPGLDSRNPQVRGNAERQACNAPIQGTAADIIKRAMVALDRELSSRDLPARLLLQVHDELVLEVRSDACTEIIFLVHEAMECAAELRTPLRVESGAGASWADAKG